MPTTSVGKGFGQQCSLDGMGEFVVLYGIVGIIRREVIAAGGEIKTDVIMVAGNGGNTL